MVFNRWAADDFLRLQCMTKAQLAGKAGIAPGYITELLNGTKERPTRTTVRKLADALNVNWRSLYFELPSEAAA